MRLKSIHFALNAFVMLRTWPTIIIIILPEHTAIRADEYPELHVQKENRERERESPGVG